MKQFGGPRPQEEITENLKKYHFFLDRTQYDRGSDYLDYYAGEIEGQPIMLLMICPWNGCFIACDFHKNLLGSERSALDGTPWYDAVLEAIYQPLPKGTEASCEPPADDRAAVKQALLRDSIAIKNFMEDSK